jgi:predicted alpha/beta hydrolase family esterase
MSPTWGRGNRNLGTPAEPGYRCAMNASSSPLASLGPVLNVPGLGSSGPDHWQSRWEALAPEAFRRVVQRDWDRPALGDWLTALEAAVAEGGPGLLLAAHSLSCSLVARWATQTQLARNVTGALLVAPADVDAPTIPAEAAGFAPMPRSPLPFPSILVVSDDDPYATVQRAEAFAAAWGGRLVLVRGGGHLNAASGLGDWPQGLALLGDLRLT